jgi:hypothetical protein
MWECPKCGERIEELFDPCWACGTSRDGTEDPAFRPEEDLSTSPMDPQYLLRSRGSAVGAGTGAVLGLLHPTVVGAIAYAANPFSVGWQTVAFVLLIGLFWAPFAALCGGIAGFVGALQQNQGAAVATGAIGGMVCHAVFVYATFGAIQKPVFLCSLAIAALIGSLAGLAGLHAGRDESRL